MINLNKKVKIKKKINKNKTNKKVLFLILAPVLLCLIGLSFYLIYLNINGEAKYLKIELKGKKYIVLNYLDNYEDKGATAFYKNKDISKDIKVKKNINFEKLGTYTYVYTIKYKKQVKTIKRTVKIETANDTKTTGKYLYLNFSLAVQREIDEEKKIFKHKTLTNLVSRPIKLRIKKITQEVIQIRAISKN